MLQFNKRNSISVREGHVKGPNSTGLTGFPVRAPDKCFTNKCGGEMRCVHPSEIRSTLERVRAAQSWLKKILVPSENSKTVIAVRNALETDLWIVASNNYDMMPGTIRAGAAS